MQDVSPSQAPKAIKRDPLQRAIQAAESKMWTVRPDEDLNRLMRRVIEEFGRNTGFWIHECLRAGLSQYAGKKDLPPKFVKPTVIEIGGRKNAR